MELFGEYLARCVFSKAVSLGGGMDLGYLPLLGEMEATGNKPLRALILRRLKMSVSPSNRVCQTMAYLFGSLQFRRLLDGCL